MAYHTVNLPLERRRLDRLARRPHTGVGPLPRDFDQEAAATPSPQSEA
jgi:hypothetical protein